MIASASVEAFGAVFALSGVHQASVQVSSRTILLELAVDVAERPTYIGLANTALAPVSFAAPLVAGLMADRLGFGTVFVAAAALSVLGLVLLLARVREPRGAARGPRDASADRAR